MAEEFDPRRAKAGQTFTYVDAEGAQQTIRADDEGVLRPRNAAEQTLADTFGLPRARSVMKAEAEEADADDDAEAGEAEADGEEASE